MLGTGHARGLRLGGSRDPPAAFEGSWYALVLSRNVRWSHRRYVRARRPTLRDNRFTIASGKLSLWANWLRDAGSYWSESLMVLSPEGWYTLCRGRRPRSQCAIGFRSRCVNGAMPGTGHARGLRLSGSRDPPAPFEGSGGALDLSRNVRWSHRRCVRARRPTLRQEAAAASREVTPPSPCSRQRALR